MYNFSKQLPAENSPAAVPMLHCQVQTPAWDSISPSWSGSNPPSSLPGSCTPITPKTGLAPLLLLMLCSLPAWGPRSPSRVSSSQVPTAHSSLTSCGINHRAWCDSPICVPHWMSDKTQMMNWISLSWSPCNYDEHSFLQRQESVVNENLGFKGNQSPVQGDFSENASLCLRSLMCKWGEMA